MGSCNSIAQTKQTQKSYHASSAMQAVTELDKSCEWYSSPQRKFASAGTFHQYFHQSFFHIFVFKSIGLDGAMFLTLILEQYPLSYLGN